ncbi:MAG: ABC transporter permease, partial [Planctomycetota bacterium]
VGREFQESKGLGVGDRFLCTDRGVEHEFAIVGVVTSPGLELVSKFFNIGEEYIDQSIHAVFGSRDDMRTRFGSDNIQLVQIQFDWDRLPEVAPERPRGSDIGEDSWYANWAVAEIQDRLAGYGVIEAGSGVTIREQITLFVGGSLYVFTGVAVIAMLKACFGVANLIVASIEARRFEFGVLRALGGQPTMLVRLVIGEAILIGVTAALLGTLMGFQGSWAGMRIYQLLLGLPVGLDPAWGPIFFGWGVVLVFTIGSAAPAVLRLNQAKTRELLASVRG